MRIRTMRGVFPMVVLSLLGAAGCGGGDGRNAACNLAACGGEVVGTWTVSDSCVPQDTSVIPVPAELMAACPGFTVGAVDVDVSGALTFSADGSYSIQLTSTARADMNVPASCLMGLTCAQLDALLQLELGQDPDIQSLTCSGSSGCTCTVVSTPMTSSEAGTYTTAGTSLVTTSTGGAPETVGYCVQGNTIVFRDSGTGTDGAAIIARK